MTIVAWDGKSLAADRLADAGGMKRTTTKIFRFDGGLFGGCGSTSKCLEMFEWIKLGENPRTCPEYQRTDDYQGIIVVRNDKSVWLWGQGPHPYRLEDPFTAIGSGRDFAIAAMHLGKNAYGAVEVACHYDTGCGVGIDVLTLD